MRGTYPKKDHTVLIALSVLAAVSLLATAVWFVTRDSPVQAPRSLPSAWPTAGAEAIRPVPMPTGELAAALPPSTQGQVLCTAVPEETWSRVLGGPVLREARLGSCHVVTADLEATAGTYDRAPLTGVEPSEVTVAGHRATLTKSPISPAIDAILTVRLADTGEPWATPQLQLRVGTQLGVRAERDFREMALTLGSAMVGAITTPGPPLPGGDELRRPRELSPIAGTGIADVAYPLVMGQLCTQLSRGLGRALDEVKPDWPATCGYKANGLEVRLAHNSATTTKFFRDRLAGRPADVEERGGVVEVQLVDGSAQTLVITFYDPEGTTPGIRAFAEKVVPPLLGR